jgi:hypothetical protein
MICRKRQPRIEGGLDITPDPLPERDRRESKKKVIQWTSRYLMYVELKKAEVSYD